MSPWLNEFSYHPAALETLVAIGDNGRFPHALLLEGMTGSGRKTFARLLAAALLCHSPQRPCGVCESCRKIRQDIHPDVIFLSGQGGARSFHIDVIRELKLSAYVRPNEGDCKVYILTEAQNMTVQAQNALLKLLEEPPAHVCFLLTCNNRSALLPTILSRVQVIPINTPSVPQCAQALEQLRPGRRLEDYSGAAQAAGGSIGLALEILENGGETLQGQALELLELLARGDEYSLLARLGGWERDREGLLALLTALRRLAAERLVTPEEDGPGLTALQLVRIADIIDLTTSQVSQNGNLTLLVTALASRLKSSL